ncbi:MAG: hypothetical protein IT337_12425 [Thermomicrobiales bacterium]|nr:hypothetical protein [Thermomicrobiales bacterium]
MRITKITRAYVRRYRDNGQITAYVAWQGQDDRPGYQHGRTEGPARTKPEHVADTAIHVGGRRLYVGQHMFALLRRAARERIAIEIETW